MFLELAFTVRQELSEYMHHLIKGVLHSSTALKNTVYTINEETKAWRIWGILGITDLLNSRIITLDLKLLVRDPSPCLTHLSISHIDPSCAR